MKLNSLIIYLIAAYLVSACSSSETAEDVLEPKQPINLELTRAESDVAKQTLSFNTDLLDAFCKYSDASENIAVSPVTMFISLSMLANASESEFRQSILDALGSSDLSGISSLANKFLTTLPYMDSGTPLSIASSVWYKNDYNLSKSFEECMKNYYQSEIFGIDSFENGGIDEINNWISDRTDGRIKEIIKPLKYDILAAFVSTLYFQGDWSIPFDKKETSKQPFNGLDGITSVEMMHRQAYLPYFENDYFSAVYLNFGSSNFRAMFILPNEFRQIKGKMDPGIIGKVNNADFQLANVDFKLPKFKISTNLKDLREIISSMGIDLIFPQEVTIFDEKPEVFVHPFHNCSIEINEKGAIGSAASSVVLEDVSPMPKDKTLRNLHLNRPFYFIITERTTGHSILAGHVTNLKLSNLKSPE